MYNKPMNCLETELGKIEYRYDKRGVQTLLLLNGGHSNADMRDGEQYFIDNNYSVISFNRPGYGNTDSSLDVGFGDFESALNLTLEYLKIKSVTVAGLSAGGRSAMRFCELYPDSCDGLILMSATSFGKWPDISTRLAAYVSFNPFIERYTWGLICLLMRRYPRKMTELLFSSMTSLNSGQVLSTYSAQSLRTIKAMFMGFRSGSGFMNDISARSRRGDPTKIITPTLIIHSKYDRAVSPSHPTKTASQITNSILHINSTESHLMWLSPKWPDTEKVIDTFVKSTRR